MDDDTLDQAIKRFELERAYAFQRALEVQAEVAALQARTGEPLTEASSIQAAAELVILLCGAGRADLAAAVVTSAAAVAASLAAFHAHVDEWGYAPTADGLKRTIDLWDALMTTIDDRDRVCADVIVALRTTGAGPATGPAD